MDWQLANAQKQLKAERDRRGIKAPLSTDAPRQPRPSTGIIGAGDQLPQEATQAARPTALAREHVKVYPTLAKAFRGRDPRNPKRTLAAVGRVYFLSRAHDAQGAGKVALSELRELITQATGMTRRNLRGILRQGHGLAWRVTDDHVYLYSPARVSIALDAGALRGQPVYVPVADLTGGIQQVRATFFTTYHGGRSASMPITRQTLRELTGVPERTQQVYDKVTNTAVSTNIASAGEAATQENRQRRAWEHGRASFKFIDHRGVNFRKGAAVIAWRLPNSYGAIYEQAPRGRQRKHNQKINLVIKRQPGNGSEIVRTYHPSVRIAARQASRDPGHDHYYPTGRTLTATVHRPPGGDPGADLWRAIA